VGLTLARARAVEANGCGTVVVWVRCDPEVIKIAGLFAITGSPSGPEREAASRIAVENINKDSSILPNTQLVMLTYNTTASEPVRPFSSPPGSPYTTIRALLKDTSQEKTLAP
jgi:hypothetical protein